MNLIGLNKRTDLTLSWSPTLSWSFTGLWKSNHILFQDFLPSFPASQSEHKIGITSVHFLSQTPSYFIAVFTSLSAISPDPQPKSHQGTEGGEKLTWSVGTACPEYRSGKIASPAHCQRAWSSPDETLVWGWYSVPCNLNTAKAISNP